jgi:hypothetical protein
MSTVLRHVRYVQKQHVLCEIRDSHDAKKIVFWDVIPCSLVDMYPEDGGSGSLLNVGTYLPNCTAAQYRDHIASIVL